jgi:hypothetical protein
LCYDEHKAEDLDTDGEDHVADEWRYLCMMNPIKPRKNVEPNVPLNDPLDQMRRRKRH